MLSIGRNISDASDKRPLTGHETHEPVDCVISGYLCGSRILVHGSKQTSGTRRLSSSGGSLLNFEVKTESQLSKFKFHFVAS